MHLEGWRRDIDRVDVGGDCLWQVRSELFARTRFHADRYRSGGAADIGKPSYPLLYDVDLQLVPSRLGRGRHRKGDLHDITLLQARHDGAPIVEGHDGAIGIAPMIADAERHLPIGSAYIADLHVDFASQAGRQPLWRRPNEQFGSTIIRR